MALAGNASSEELAEALLLRSESALTPLVGDAEAAVQDEAEQIAARVGMEAWEIELAFIAGLVLSLLILCMIGYCCAAAKKKSRSHRTMKGDSILDTARGYDRIRPQI